jgi:molybdopterin synthase sulfur carrier subunit
MVLVSTISGRVRTLTGGVGEFEIEASTVRQLISELERKFPGLGAHVEEYMAIAIDGEIHQDALGTQLAPDSEIVLIPRISGG